jgi:hypothetical protein
MGETDPEELADQLEKEADDLEGKNQELGQRTKHVAQDWQRKREDESVPGAPPPEGEGEEDADSGDAES